MEKKLPIFLLEIKENDDTSGVDFVALVDEPAIGINWLAFKEEKPFAFQITNEDQHIISGPLMVPDKPMYRMADEVHPEHYVVFTADTVKNICLKFFRKGFTSNVNLMHDGDATPTGIYMFESFLIDPVRGINPPQQFKDLPAGTWFGSYKVDNPAVWDELIKTGKFRGFSVEGLFTYAAMTGNVQEMHAHKLMEEIDELLDF